MIQPQLVFVAGELNGANFWMRLFHVSATKMLPLPSTPTPHGWLNCPFPLPAVRCVMNIPTR